MSVEQISETPLSGLRFPTSDDLVNYTASNTQSEVTVPVSVVEERLQDKERIDGIIIMYCKCACNILHCIVYTCIHQNM